MDFYCQSNKKKQSRFTSLVGASFLLPIMLLLLYGCASDSTKKSNDKMGGLVSVSSGRADLSGMIEGRGFDDIDASLDLKVSVKKIEGFPEYAYTNLLKEQIFRAFNNAGLRSGARPGLSISAVLVEVRFSEGRIDPSNPSLLRVRCDVKDASGVLLESNFFETRHVAAPIKQTGMLPVVPAGFNGRDWQALRKMMPAVAAIITKFISRQREGNLTEEIGAEVNSDGILKDNPYGLTELTNNDIREAIQSNKNK